jgi:hypothetical protein
MRILETNRPLVEVALTQSDTASLAHDKALIDVFERFALDPLETVPADRITIEEFQAKRWPQMNATAQDLKQEHAARHARQLHDAPNASAKFRQSMANSAACGVLTTARRAGTDGKVCN